MTKIRVFISSVQSEFEKERLALFNYLISDALLGLFYEPFIFEKLPATSKSVTQVYLKQVEHCDIYLDIFGKEYGLEDKFGIFPTEYEFDHATKHHKTRLVFLNATTMSDSHPKEQLLICKAEQLIVRGKFDTVLNLKNSVYNALVRYLEEHEYIRTTPFDASLSKNATLDDLDADKVYEFVALARSKRAFPLNPGTGIRTILTHLNLLHNDQLSNAAVLLFGNTRTFRDKT